VGELLLRTSILDEVDPALANQLVGRCDARGALDRLARAHAFVTQVHPSRFRYQRPFRTMLRDTLAATRPDLVQPLHAAAARWYAEHRSPAAAVTHAARAGDWEVAVGTAVEQLGVAWLLTAPEAEQCRAVLADLPDGRPGVAAELLRSVLALARYDTAGARRAVDRAREYADRLAAPSATVVLGIATVEVLLARLGGGLDGAEPAVARAEAGWRAIPPGASVDEPRTRALVLANLGVAQLWAGRLAAARTTLDRAATSTEPGTEYAAHDALGHLALLEMYEGRMHQADKYAGESLAIADRAGIRPAARTGAASAALAAIALVWNDLPAAREHAARAIQATGSRHDPPTAVTIALVRAWAACMRHDGRRAVAATDTARGLLPRQHPPQLIADRIELTALWGYLILGDLTAARGSVDRIHDPAERALGLGYLLEAEGDQARARTALAGVSAHNARPSALQYAALALGRLALADGDLPAATDALRDALDYGRPERRRRPVSDAGGWTRELLKDNAALAGQHGWLRPPADTGAAATGPAPHVEPLTRRELDVLRCLADALSTRDIAETLYLSVNTVKTHLKSIYRKLGTSGRSATARRARELNLLRDTDQG
jgi:LuxR family maltose regulon positive regulatory protein